MTTTELVERCLQRILQAARDAENGKSLHIAGDDIDSALCGAVEAFAFIGDRHPSEGFAELLQMLGCEPHADFTPYGHMIDSAINKIESQIDAWEKKPI